MKRLMTPMAIASLLVGACTSEDDSNRIVGQLESDRVEITAEVQELVTEKIAAEGQVVTAGEPLMQQNTDRIEVYLAEARAAVGQHQARLDELIRGPRRELIVAARANVDGAIHKQEFTRIQLKREEDLLARDLASPTTRDRAKSSMDAASADLAAKRAQLEELLTGTTIEELNQADQALKQAQARVSSLTIDLLRHRTLAPVNGIVDSILFEPGERPQPGQPLLIMLAGTQPYARVYVPESVRATTRPGMAARVHVDGIAAPFDGRLRWVASEAAFTPYFALTEHDRGRLSYLAKVDFDYRGERLPDGIPVEVEILR